MSKFFCLLLVVAVLPTWAESHDRVLVGNDPKSDVIADNYEAGPYLIYDCQEKHWVCVQKSYYDDCKTKREKDLVTIEVHGQCAPIGEFPTKRSCFQRQLFMTGHNHGTRFCILPKWKQNEMELEFNQSEFPHFSQSQK